VRGGSILPILLHEGCSALDLCYQNSMRLEIYPDSDGTATGDIYIDDGVSLEYQNQDSSKSVILNYKFASNSLSVSSNNAVFELGT